MSAEKKQRAFHGLNSDFNKEKRSFLLIFFYHQKTKDHSMSFTRTATTDGFGRSVQTGLTITHPYRLTCRYSFAKSSMAEAGVLSLTFQDGLCAAWRPVSASCTD